MTTTIRTDSPRELLALVPYQLGFRPSESAVVLSLRRGTRVGLVARVDLADLASPQTGPQVARSLVGHLLADGAGVAVLVLYTAEDLQADPSTGRRAVAQLADAADGLLPEPDCWVVGPGGYHALECPDRACCPEGGRPLAELEGTRVGAEMVLLGAAVAGSREELATLPDASPTARRAARRAAQRWERRGGDAIEHGQVHRWRRDGLALWRSLLGAEEHGATDLGRLQAALDDVLVRDAVLLDLVPGRTRLADRVVAGWTGDEVGEALGLIVDPGRGVAPPAGRIEDAVELLRQVAGHRPRAAVPAISLLAMLAWWTGDGAKAAVLVQRALATEPGYRLARLLEEALTVGMPPGWVRSASS
ncbi:DUF4192 domain-containing protein [Actinotalea sp. M2MS4P-6]|uniref:DUF4192 domain-containing protein n=1 Tax=Actinotalea sp. M2MS4P-6 TaxID=2983762 RepID=UPI0021E4AB0D|nr:DUF4192 domain-containing protein [Actinotalea sp. M2MS4P-6]MCV2396474.1 DUF4192 domain-containing protein [Actinotalea sp. M2MS4P-6]